MKTNITKHPAAEAGAHITKKIQQHATDDILLLISGGSALSVLDYINESVVSKKLTVGVVDERYTEDTAGNNFLQMSEKPLFKAIIERGGGALSTEVSANEPFDIFYNRIKKLYETYFNTHTQAYTIAIFGIGDDGHTASIFPEAETEFMNLYRNEQIVVPVFKEDTTYPERITITPRCIEDYVSEVVLYAIGENKCNTVITDMYNKDLHEHQIPALIPAAHPNSTLFTDCSNIQP